LAVHLGLEEAFTNAVQHGNQSEPGKKVIVKYKIDAKKIIFSVKDEGKGFTPDEIPNPTWGKIFIKPAERGLFLIRSFMDKVNFNKKGKLRLHDEI